MPAASSPEATAPAHSRWILVLLALAALSLGAAVLNVGSPTPADSHVVRLSQYVALGLILTALLLGWRNLHHTRPTGQPRTHTDVEHASAEISPAGLYSVFDAIPGMMFVMSTDGLTEYVNQPMRAHIGAPLSAFKNHGWQTLVHPEDSPRLMGGWLNAVQIQAPFDMEYRLMHFDHTWRWVHCRVAPCKDAAGAVRRWYGVVVDIHERQRATEALKQNEYAMRMTIETIPALVWRATPSGHLEYINDRVLEFTGKTLTDFAQSGWVDLVHPEDLEPTMQVLQHCFATGSSYAVTYRMRGTNRDFRWFQVRAEPLRDADGKIMHWYGLHIDIDDLRNAEDTLRARERQLRLVTETIPALIWTADPTGQVNYNNRRVIDFTGKSLEELNSHGWFPLVHPDDLPIVQQSWFASVKSGMPFEVTRRMRTAAGDYRWLSARAEALRDPEGRIVCWYGIDIDIDDRKRTEDAFQHAQSRLSRAAEIATVGELSASIAHELNQPLAAVVANAFACVNFLSDPADLDRARRVAASIVRDGNAAAAVVHKMRALFKRSVPQFLTLDSADFIIESVRLLQDELRAKGVQLTWELASSLPRITADRVQMQQVIHNLVRNAIEAMEETHDRTRELMIGARCIENDRLLIRVRDRGKGIPDTDKIFEPFFTTKPSGMGVGLSICRSIAEAHAGRLSACANEDGVGSTFSLVLPLSPPTLASQSH